MIIKKGNKVKILTGKDKNKEGEIIELDRARNRAKVKGLNIIKKLERPIIFDAKIYSLFFSTNVAALVTLANCGHSEIPIAKIST